MSTPIETNTDQLQEVLQQVYNLPSRSGGGSVTPDLVVAIAGSANGWVSTLSKDAEIVIESGTVEDTIAKMVNGGSANVLVKLTYYYDNAKYYMSFIPENIKATILADRPYALSVIFGPLTYYSDISSSDVQLANLVFYVGGYTKFELFDYRTSNTNERVDPIIRE